MQIALHKNARTTPAVCAEIAASNESARAQAVRHGISEQTVRKWQRRQSVQDLSHTAHRLQTQLSPAQEVVVVHLRRALLLPLDDLLAVTREFICDKVSRSGLDRCLRRHGVGNLNALKPAEPAQPHKAFKNYVPGYLHMDVKYLPQMQDETKRRYLFVAIDRATRWVFVQIKANKTAASAKAFLKGRIQGRSATKMNPEMGGCSGCIACKTAIPKAGSATAWMYSIFSWPRPLPPEKKTASFAWRCCSTAM